MIGVGKRRGCCAPGLSAKNLPDQLFCYAPMARVMSINTEVNIASVRRPVCVLGRRTMIELINRYRRQSGGCSDGRMDRWSSIVKTAKNRIMGQFAKRKDGLKVGPLQFHAPERGGMTWPLRRWACSGGTQRTAFVMRTSFSITPSPA